MTPTASCDPFSPATSLLREMAEGRTTSASITSTYLDRIARHDDKLHAFIAVYEEEAKAAAAAADLAIGAGHRVGPLHGLPIAVKDIIDIEGRITTGGSKVWAQRVSPVTATLVDHLMGAGLIVLGKTHTVEFAMGSFGTNQFMGTPWNPWDNDVHRIPGGSSAGSGVSVAAGLAPWAIGTDTGGSVRIPSAFCGLVGLKTTIGKVSCHGVLPLSATLDTPGPMCRTVEDAAILYDILRGRGRVHPERLIPAGLRAGVSGLRLGRLPPSEREQADDEVLSAYDAALELLQSLGAQIVDVSLPASFAEMGSVVGRIIGAEGFFFVGHLTEDRSLPIDNDVRPRIGLGRDMSAKQYLQLLQQQQTFKEQLEDAFSEIDALLTPTTQTAAPPVAEVNQSGTAAHFTRWVNLVERCALVLPDGQTASGLPISLQIVCRGGQEAMALRIGWAFEQASSWHLRRPAGFAT